MLFRILILNLLTFKFTFVVLAVVSDLLLYIIPQYDIFKTTSFFSMILNHTHADKEFFSKYSHEPPSWFEFLLDTTGEKLVTHLTKGAEPSAAYLISLFVDKASTPITNTGGPPAQRAYSAQLWDLALFTASHVRWCPRVLEQVPTSILQRLLSHLVKTTVPVETRALDTNELELEEIPKQGLAALFLYHRWVIAAYVQLQLPRKPGKKSTEMPGYLPTLPALQLIEQELPHSKDFLDKIGQEKPQLMIPHAGTCSQNGTDHLNNHGNLLHANTSAAQSYFDLGVLAFFHQEYSEAYQHFKNAEALYDLSDHYFLSFNKDKVDHYLHGLQYLTHLADIRDHSLLSQLELTKANDYTGCVDLLLKDNTEQVLSYTYRRTFVKEVYEVCKDSTLCKHAFICNVLLQVAMGKCVDGRFWALLKEDKGLVVDFLIKATQTMMKDCKADVKLLLKYFFLGLVSKNILKDKRSDILAAVGSGLGIWFIGDMMPVLTKPSTMLTYAKSKESEIVNYYNDLAAETKFINIKDIISKICQLQPNFHMQPFCDRIFKDVRTTQAFLPLTDSLACPRPLAFVLCNRLAQLCHYECYKEAMLLIADIKEYLKNAQYAAFKRGNSTKLLDRLETIIEALHINDTLCHSKKKVRLSEDFTSSVSRLSGSNNQACPLKSNIIPAVLLNLKAQPTLQNSGDGFEFIAGEIWLFLQNQDHNLGRLFKLLVPMHSANPPSSIVNRVDLVSFCCNFVEEQSLELLVGILVHLFNSTVDDQWHNITYNVITRTWPELGKEVKT